jgi:ferrous iron transport protein B
LGAKREKSAQKNLKQLALVGAPNVGKSALFNALTGLYATVSNYPGTTVEVSRGRTAIAGQTWEIVDTPGMYSLLPSSEEERAARAILFVEKPALVLQVVDAKNLERLLPQTFQLLETGLPLILVLNLMDEAEKRQVSIDTIGLSHALGVPVVATAATLGRGMKELKEEIGRDPQAHAGFDLAYGAEVEEAVARIGREFEGTNTVSARALALLAVSGEVAAEIITDEKKAARIAAELKTSFGELNPSAVAQISAQRRRKAEELTAQFVKYPKFKPKRFAEWLSDFLINPWTGLPVLALVLYYGLYCFVGGFGAGVVVDYLENEIFMRFVNPFMVNLCAEYVAWESVRELLAGEYGVLTLGVRYAVAIIMPLAAFFFLFFSILEDSGYLPRLAMLVDGIFKRIGLSGRGVIPIVLGLGCATMATMVTRTLPTARERLIATTLLALAVPCSAQLGIIMALLYDNSIAFGIWLAVITGVFLTVGFLAAHVVPGERPRFYMELPPMRLPKLANVLLKTYARLAWYFKEIMPIFIVAGVLIWLGQMTGAFGLLTDALTQPVRLLGLPDETSKIFLYGFFRRDYGAAGLYDLNNQGLLNASQMTVAVIALTLFLPCIAQFVVNVRERGLKTGVAISGLILVISFSVAFAVNLFLQQTGILS